VASSDAWNWGANIGNRVMEEKEAHKQALSDEQFQEKHNEIQGMIDNLQSRLPTLDPTSTDYLKAKDQLAQALQARDEHWKSLEHPNAILKFGKMLGRDLRFSKQPTSVPVAPPVYAQPTMDINGEKVNTGPAYKVQGPQTPAQVKAQGEATQLASAVPLSPEEQATEEAKAGAAGNLVAFQSKLKLYDQQNPHATAPDATEDEKQARQEYINGLLGDKTKEPVESWTAVKDANPEKMPDGTYRQLGVNKKGEYSYHQMPEGYVPPDKKSGKLSNIEQERESYRQTHNIPSSQPLTFDQERDFVKQMALARNPFGQAHLDIAEKGLNLREQESGFKDFLALQKQLTPIERVISTASEAPGYVSNPTGPGDVALTLAFFDAIKTTGVRFTKQEQDFIVGSRGFMEGMQAKFNHGFEGTVFSPDQRKLIAGIVKKAGDTAAQQKNTLVGGAKSFNPKAAAAAGDTTPPVNPSKPQGAFGTVPHNGKNYWVDSQGNNLGLAP
jgi:hypothetical protein